MKKVSAILARVQPFGYLCSILKQQHYASTSKQQFNVQAGTGVGSGNAPAQFMHNALRRTLSPGYFLFPKQPAL